MGLVAGLELELDLGLGLGMGWDWLQDWSRSWIWV